MIVMVTATRRGLTISQKQYLYTYLTEHQRDIRWFLHGDCKGGDSDAHTIAFDLNLMIHGYPGLMQRWRAGRIMHVKEPPAPELERNRTMVDRADVVLAFPKGEAEEMRGSGTWATIRYAKKTGKELHIIYPSLRVDISGGDHVS